MSFFSLLSWSNLRRKQRRCAAPKRPRVRLELELLEGRALLSFVIANPVLAPEVLAAAEHVALSDTASAFQSGSIEGAKDVDLFQFVAPRTTRMAIRQTAAFDSQLDSVLSVFDDTGTLIARNDNITPSIQHSEVQFDVVEGRTYYAEAAGFETTNEGVLISSTGDYALTFASLGDARMLVLDAAGSASVSADISTAGDMDLFQFVAPETAVLVVSLERTAGSSLDSTLTFYNSSFELLSFSDDVGGDRDSQVAFLVEAGETYYVSAAGFDTSTGDYLVSVKALVAPIIAPGAGAHVPVDGTFSEPGEVDLFVFAPPAVRKVNLSVLPVAASTVTVDLLLPDELDAGATLAVFDDSFSQVSDQSSNPLSVEFVALTGRIYLIQVSRDAAGPDQYALDIVAIPFVRQDALLGPGGGARPTSAAKSALPEQPPLVVLPSPIVIPTMPAAPRAAGGQNASIAPLGFGGNDASLVLVTTLLADPRASGAISPAAALGAASDPAAPLTVYAISTPADASAVPDAVLVAALHQVLNDSLGAANRVAQAGWLLADDTLAVLTNTVSPVGQALRSVVGDDAAVLETLGREIGDNLRHATWAIGGAFTAATRSLLDRQSRSAPAGPAPLPMPAQQQPDPSVPDELNPDELPDTEPQEKIALSALFITAGLTNLHRPRRCRDRRGLAVKSQRTK